MLESQIREYASAEELAEYVNTTVETVQLLANNIDLEPIEIDGKLLYRRHDIERFLRVWECYNRDWKRDNAREEDARESAAPHAD
jgi:hypothetical protein